MSDYANGREVGLAIGRGERDNLRDHIDDLAAEIERLQAECASAERLRLHNAQRAERAEAKVAGLVAALNSISEFGSYEGQKARKEARRALTASGLECVPGWWQQYAHGERLFFEAANSKGRRCWLVYHKEQ